MRRVEIDNLPMQKIAEEEIGATLLPTKSCFRTAQIGKFLSPFVRSVVFDRSGRVCTT